MLLNDPVYGGEPQTRAFADLFGGEKWFEDVVKGRGVNTRAGVRDGQRDERTRARVRMLPAKTVIQVNIPRLDLEAATLGHGVARIHRKVHQDLFKLGRIGMSQMEVWGQGDLQFNAFAQQFLE